MKHLALACLLALVAFTPARARDFIDSPALAADVAAGKLPPVAQRLPENPLTTLPDRAGFAPGQHGGELRFLMARAQDVRMMVVYGYARLVAYTPKLELKPDILESVESDGDRVFTLKLRRGHRWSDGHPFTTEDFRYYWEDVANNKRLAPAGPPKDLMPDGREAQGRNPRRRHHPLLLVGGRTRISCRRSRAHRRSTSSGRRTT